VAALAALVEPAARAAQPVLAARAQRVMQRHQTVARAALAARVERVVRAVQA
jgi:hypothetical protein